jgi:hypothetical protein
MGPHASTSSTDPLRQTQSPANVWHFPSWLHVPPTRPTLHWQVVSAPGKKHWPDDNPLQ